MTLKTKRIFFGSMLTVSLLLLALLSSLLYYQKAYAGKIYNNIYFGEIELSGKTKLETEQILTAKFQETLNRDIVIEANGKQVQTKLAETGLDLEPKKIIDSAYRIGRELSLWESLKSKVRSTYKRTDLSAQPSVDQELYNKFFTSLTAQLNSTPVDAALKIENGEIVAQESQSGQTIAIDNLVDTIVGLVSTEQNDKITLATTETPAKVTQADFEPAKQTATDILAKKYVFTYGTKSYSPTKPQVGNWIEFVSDETTTTAKLAQTKIKTYLNTIAKDFELTSLDRKVNANTGEIIDAGRDGLSLDKDSATAAVLSQIGKPSVNITLVTTVVAAKELKVLPEEGLVLGRFEGKYVDIDLPKQKLCRVEGQALVECYTISSGKASMPTPTGTFSVKSKHPKAWSASYGLWMPYWQQFSGPYGLHELPEWPNGFKEGEAHLGIPVSHGCVRLGIGAAEALYNWTEIGTPVYIHK